MILEQSSSVIHHTGQKSHQYQLQHWNGTIMWPFTNKRRDDLWCSGDAGTTNVNTLRTNRCAGQRMLARMHVCRKKNTSRIRRSASLCLGDYLSWWASGDTGGRTVATLKRKTKARVRLNGNAVGPVSLTCWFTGVDPVWVCDAGYREDVRCQKQAARNDGQFIHVASLMDGAAERRRRERVGGCSGEILLLLPGLWRDTGRQLSVQPRPPASTGARCWASPPVHLFSFLRLRCFLYSSNSALQPRQQNSSSRAAQTQKKRHISKARNSSSPRWVTQWQGPGKLVSSPVSVQQ